MEGRMNEGEAYERERKKKTVSCSCVTLGLRDTKFNSFILSITAMKSSFVYVSSDLVTE